jgi:hypothetical protein
MKARTAVSIVAAFVSLGGVAPSGRRSSTWLSGRVKSCGLPVGRSCRLASRNRCWCGREPGALRRRQGAGICLCGPIATECLRSGGVEQRCPVVDEQRCYSRGEQPTGPASSAARDANHGRSGGRRRKRRGGRQQRQCTARMGTRWSYRCRPRLMRPMQVWRSQSWGRSRLPEMCRALADRKAECHGTG